MGQQLTDDLSRLLAGRKPDLMDKRGEFSVLVPLVEGDEGLSLLYEVRAKTMHSQPGEICFPGGRAEGDETPEECALRETWEELGIPRTAVEVVAELDWLPQVHLVMNRIQPKLLRKLRTTIDDAMNTAGLPLIGVIPEDAQVMLCANRGIPLTSQGRKGAAMACRNIAWRLMGRRVPIMRIR